MKKLLDVENSGGIVHRTYSHIGDDGKKKITVASTQDLEPAIKRAKMLKQTENGKYTKFKAIIGGNHLNELAYKSAPLWGVTVQQAFSEIMSGKTDRAQKALRMLTDGRDFRKLQAKHY